MSRREEGLHFEIKSGPYRLTVDYAPCLADGDWFWCLAYVKNLHGANDVLFYGRCKTRRAAKNVARNSLRETIRKLELMRSLRWKTKSEAA